MRRVTGSAVLVLGVATAGIGIASAAQHHANRPTTVTTPSASSATTPTPLDNTSSSELTSVEGTVNSISNPTFVLNEKDGTSVSVQTTSTTFFSKGNAGATFADVQPGTSLEVYGTPGSSIGTFVATSVTIDPSSSPVTLTPVASSPVTTYADDAQGDNQSNTTSPGDDQGDNQSNTTSPGDDQGDNASSTTSPGDDQGGDQSSSFAPGQGDGAGGPASTVTNGSSAGSDNGSNAGD